MKYVRIGGLERTGTNWLHWLLAHNLTEYEPVWDYLGWKHGALLPPDRGKNVPQELRCAYFAGQILYIWLVKSPLEWAVSYRRYCGVQPADSVAMWNRQNRLWLDEVRRIQVAGRKAGRAMVIRYHDLLLDPERIVRTKIVPAMPGTHVRGWVDCGQRFDADIHPTTEEFRREYYTQLDYLEELSPQEEQDMERQIDETVLDELGYDYLR